jgi:proteasome assembly chaperone (PAC2) family protein
MPYTRIEQIPTLRDPLLLVAFAGWNDAAESATTALRVLIEKWSAERFADIDPEEFYDFTVTRPTVNVGPDFQRSLEWPENSFFFHADPFLERDVILLVGTEPQLKWRAFTAEIMNVADQCGVSQVITLGALLADAPHTRPVPIIGFTTTEEMAERLREFHVGPTRYQGPTGILGAVHDAAKQRGLAAVSLWASVPHYLGITQNPKIAEALLRVIDVLYGLHVDMEEIEKAVRRFDQQINAIIVTNPEAAAYVRELERRAEGVVEGEAADTSEAGLPPSEALIKDLEDFLRRRRQQEGLG